MPDTNIFTGSFDPPTLGHLSIIKRAAILLGQVTVVVCTNLDKKHMFAHDDRVAMVTNMVANIPNVSVISLPPGRLLPYLLTQLNCKVLIRGVRNGLDLEYERAIEQFVKEYGIEEVVYLLNEPHLANISSSITRNHLLVMKENKNMTSIIFNYIPPSVFDVLVTLPFTVDCK